MILISVVVITFNEEKKLARCLDSVQKIADEIVIVDSNSTDNTIIIAQRYKARIIQHQFIGYGQQKNFATMQAANNWILSLDADEVVSPELVQSIIEIKNGPEFYVYQMARLTNYCGKWIRHCGWYPDKQTRLFDRTKGSWLEPKVHEYWRTADKKAIRGMLKGDLLHYSFDSLTEHVKKIEKYTELAALEAVSKGKKAGLMKIMVAPKWRFFSEFFLKLGFLDGYYGYIICRLSAYAAFIKYSKINQYYKTTKTNDSFSGSVK
jgi:glycosyltransferase involved in cell wall biosynthesis